ncbi:MAG: hypothetical protein LBT18_05835 [Endomicrobium sp.]|jgi:predicted outer membrane repeat protein|nr:hypothetical protein [Endomicrobium sp.]
MSGNVKISGGIAGNGTINKINAGSFLLGGDNSYYNGLFSQSGGTTTISGKYFTGTSSITASELELADGSSINGSTIGLWDHGKLDITAASGLTISGGQVTGDGTTLIDKTGTGKLTLSGDNSGFSGLYKQSAGTTTVGGTSEIFDGTNTISTSLLAITADDILDANSKSLFNISSGTAVNFELQNLTVQNALGANGSVINAGNSLSTTTISNVVFRNNRSSAKGGVIYVPNGSTVSLTDVKFTSNTAASNGGAICVNGGILNIINTGGFITEFSGNKADGKSNAIHLEGNAVVNFDGVGEVKMYDAMTSDGNNSTINILGALEFDLLSDEKSTISNLNVKDNSRFDLKGNASLEVKDNLVIEENAEFAWNGRECILAGNYTQHGTLSLDIFDRSTSSGKLSKAYSSSSGNTSFYISDYIQANGQVFLNENSSKLNIWLNGNVASDDSVTRAYRIIKYGALSGMFKEVTFGPDSDLEPNYKEVTFGPDPDLAPNYNVVYGYEDHWVVLLLKGPSSQTNFASLEGLSFNQIETAKTIDYLSDKVAEDSNLGVSIILLDMLPEDKQKEALYDLSGYFISNVIISQAFNNTKKDVYNRLYNYKEYEEPSKGIWGQIQGSLINVDSDIESPYKFKVRNGGILAGFDTMTNENITVGIFGKFDKSWIKQNINEAQVSSYGLGVYGGLVKEQFDVKTILSGSMNKYETTREIRFDNNNKGKGEFDGINGSLDVEAGYRIPLTESEIFGKMKLRPYAGAAAAIVHTDAFKETGAYALSLDVKDNNYFRSSLRAGVGLTGEMNRFRWNVSVGADYLVAGKNYEITSTFIDTDKKFQSRSVTVGELGIEGDLGARYYVTEGLEIYANANVLGADKYRSLYGNIGVRYSFGSWIGKKTKKEEKANIVEMNTRQ